MDLLSLNWEEKIGWKKVSFCWEFKLFEKKRIDNRKVELGIPI